MSSTHMDFSPLIIDRKQDITSWPEGDVTGLKTRDQNRYQKRKAAIKEYFQSEASPEEISLRHHLSTKDSLETLARRCLMLHEDGQPWGLRALVPGVRVVDQSVLAEAENSEPNAPISAEDEEDQGAGEREAMTLIETIELPVTPAPATTEERSTENVEQENFPVVTENEPAEQEDFPAVIENESAEAEEVEQEDFPAIVGKEPAEAEEVEQEDFPVVIENESAEAEEAEQEDFPIVAENKAAELEEVEQEDFPAVAENEFSVEEEVEQEDFPEMEDRAEEIEEPTAKLEDGVKAEDASEEQEEVEQEDFPEAVSFSAEIASAGPESENADDPVAQKADATQELIIEEVGNSEEEDATHELTAEETENAEEQTQELVAEENGGEEESAEEGQTQKLTREADAIFAEENAELEVSEVVAEDGDESEVSEVVAEENAEPEMVDERAEVAELDTVEVAQVKAEERRERVASVETIEVPAAALAALEEAERAADLATAETVETSAIVAEEQTADLAENDMPEPVAEQVEESVLGKLHRYSRQLGLAQALKKTMKPLAESGRYQITGSQAALKHAMRRRWNKQSKQKKYRRWVRIVSAAVIVSILVVLAIPLCVGLVGYSTYNNIKGIANDGVSNLLAIQDLIPANKNDLFSVLDPQKLTNAQTKLNKAQDDFLQLQDMVNRPDIQSLLQQWAPEYSNKLDMARHLVQVALDVSRMGQELIGVAQIGSNVVHGGSLLSSNSTKPLLTADDVSAVQAALVHAQYYIGDIQTQMSQVNLASMPFGSASQKAKLGKYLQEIPQAQSMISQAQGLVGPVSWLLGVGTPRKFLVQTLDRGELRPSGGFEGQYGVLSLDNGRLGPFSLTDITKLDYAENGNEFGNHPPSQYKWMDFGFFGVRDANLSADYPTTAQMVMQLFQAEGGGPVDGDIQITPVIIEQFLDLTGPLYIAQYNDTVTSQNLEQKLHDYQQDPKLIALQKKITGSDTHSTRKAFTGEVGSLLLDRAKHLKMQQLLDFGKIALKDLKSRDLQIYFTNPVAEQWLQQNEDSGAMPSFTNNVDGFMVVQANVSISKAAQFVQTSFNDQVKLDASGGATHDLTITLNYNQTGPVWGFNTYADYLRVYAPANAQFINGYGFDTGRTLCTSSGKAPPPPGPTPTPGTNPSPTPTTTPTTGTPSDTGGSYSDIYPIYGCGSFYHTSPNTDYRYCQGGNYELGYDGMMAKPWPIQELGGPSQKGSDLPGYNMWGGMTLTPKNCWSKIELTWYVPNVVQHTPGQSPYQMIVGHQAGWPDNTQVSVDASAQQGLANLSFNNTINVDTLIAMPALPKPQPPKPPTTPTPAATPTGKKH